MPIHVDMPPAEWLTGDSEEHRLTELGGLLRYCKEIAIDTETTGLDNLNDRVLYWSLSMRDGPRVRRIGLRSDLLSRYRQDMSCSEDRRWLLANAKFDMHMLANSNILLRGVINDIAVQHALLYEDMSHRLKDIHYQIFSWTWASFEETFGKVNKRDPLDSIGARLRACEKYDLNKLVEYICNDAYGTLMLYEELRSRMEAKKTWSVVPDKISNLWEYFERTEAPFTRVLWLNERVGLGVDPNEVDRLQHEIDREEKVVRHRLNQAAGRVLSPHNNAQIVQYLYKDKGYRVPKWTSGGKTGVQQPSTDKKVLEELALETGDPVAKLIVEAKHLHNLKGTFLKALRHVDDCGRIHPSYNQNEAVTGRLSSKNPNAQNIVHPDHDVFGIRRAIVANLKGHVLGVADYAALELMLLAEASRDPKMLDIFDRGLDPHMGNASFVFGIPYDKIKEAKELEKLVKKGVLAQLERWAQEALTARQSVKTIAYG